MKQITIFTLSALFISQTSFAISRTQYLEGMFDSPIVQRDHRRVATNKQASLNSALRTLSGLKRQIRDAANKFGIDPMHIAGAIAGEHALNVGTADHLQDKNIQRRMTNEWVDQDADNALFAEMSLPQYNECRSINSDYDFWYCVVNTWYQKKNGGLIHAFTPQNGAYKAFNKTYFNPNGVGKSFGLGQLSPLRALMVSDMVSRATNIPRISFRRNGNSHQAYSDILTNERVVYYTAATIKKSIQAYAQIARFDISNNPGVVATLYNIGNERFHAKNRQRDNLRRIQNNQSLSTPESNSFGRWVLQNQGIIREAIR